MMSQPRMRKASAVVGGDGSRPRGFIPKASGDPIPCNVRPKQQCQRSKSKNKIPKSIRYDLDNALIGLCDVWFEEIKPHLVRNNIKVHVHGAAGAPAASGDHGRLPPAAPGCSHLHPGAASDGCQRLTASYADFCSTLPTASRAPSRKPPPLSLSRLPPPPPSSPTQPETITKNHCSNEGKSKPRSRRKTRPSKPSPPPPLPNWRVPRLCRTNTIISLSPTPRTNMRRIRTATPQHPSYEDDSFFQFIQPRRRVKMKHKSTQTEFSERSPKPLFTSFRTAPTPFGRCPATTTFFPPRYKGCYKNERPLCIADESPFSQDLINIIGEQNDKRIKLLYKCPAKEEVSSVMNLITSSDENPRDTFCRKKRPWR